MSDIIEKLNALHAKHKDQLPGQFHNLLWQIMVNNSLGDEFAAFHRQLSDNQPVLSLASGGYIPTCCGFADGMSEEDMDAVLDDLNEQLFGLTPDGAMGIILRSYAGSHIKRTA